ncbi:MAG: tyrosine-type recombinase/integrase, partial [Cryomorphaceae bacterium]
VKNQSHLLHEDTIKSYIGSLKTIILYYDAREGNYLSDFNSSKDVTKRIRLISLEDFESTLVHRISLSQLNKKEFMLELILWMTRIGYAKNSCGNRVKHAKAILLDAFDKGLVESFNLLKVQKPSEAKTPVTLTNDEVMSIVQLDNLTDEEKEIRDAMLLVMFTGLRRGDLVELEYDHLFSDEKSQLEIVKSMQKNRRNIVKELRIPVHPLIKDMIADKGGLPNFRKLQDSFIEDMRKLCIKAGIKSKTTSYHTKSGHSSPVLTPKTSVITLHDLRKTWATLAVENNWATIDEVSDIFQHESQDITKQHYISESQKRSVRSVQSRFDTNPIFSYLS